MTRGTNWRRTEPTKTERVMAWMEREAQWYSEHEEYPVAELAGEANRTFDWPEKFEDGHRPSDGPYRAEDWYEFMEEKRYNQALKTFKKLELPMGKDAEEE